MTFPLPTLAAQITSAGISAPSYADILSSLQASFRAIYGSDAYIAADSQDGQWLAFLAQGFNDTNNMAIAVYNSFSPTYAQGAALSSNVKINGIQRLVASYSSADGDVVGQAGITISSGVVADVNGNLWSLPTSVTIPDTGTITVTVTAQELGVIVAPAGTINKIQTPTLGWQTFTSTTDAAAGAPVESDAALRRRQAASTQLVAESVLGAIYGALANLAGVTALRLYENPTGITDSDGLPPHSISAVITGGDAVAIATTIGQKKTPGAATYGDISQEYVDPISGITYTINFYVPDQQDIKVHLTLTAGAGYVSTTEDAIAAAVAAYINALGIGNDVQYLRLIAPAYLNGSADGSTYEITAMTTAIGVDTPGVIDLPIAFNEVAICDPANVTFTVT